MPGKKKIETCLRKSTFRMVARVMLEAVSKAKAAAIAGSGDEPTARREIDQEVQFWRG